MRRLIIRIIFFCICIVSIFGKLSGQSISKTVIGTSGTYYSNNSHDIQWTLGEVSITQSSNNGFQLDEGFHAETAKTELSTAIHDLYKVTSFVISPNPTPDIINLPADLELSKVSKLKIYSNNGILHYEAPPLDRNQLDLSKLQKGIYYLLIAGPDKTGSIAKIIRM